MIDGEQGRVGGGSNVEDLMTIINDVLINK
jgi:hypothetical protein